ncbi:MAG: N-acetylmuramoyl-L-alanine amidase [Myxococcaceae bacterium]
MTLLRTHLLLTALLVAVTTAVGCGESTVLLTEEGGVDTESDPAVAEESALRTSATYDAEFQAAGTEFGVPAVLLKALAYAETRYDMVAGEAEFDGQIARYGMMALRSEVLEEAAQLVGVSVEQLKSDSKANIRAGAALLSAAATELKISRGELKGWAPALEQVSGIDDPEARKAYVRDQIFATLTQGVGELGSDMGTAISGLTTSDEDVTSLKQGLAGPDFGPAVWRASPNFDTRPTNVAMVIIHTCESSYSSCWSWLTQARSGVSAHYVVSPDSEVSQLVREGNRGWHIGATYNCKLNGNAECLRTGTSSNNFTVGIEHGGFASQKTWPAAQLDASARLSCSISKNHNIPRDRFHYVGHGQLQPYNRTDPGPNWPWTTYMAKLNAVCATAPVEPTNPTPPPVTPTNPTNPQVPPSASALVIDSNNLKNDQSKGYLQVSTTWTGTSTTRGFFGTGYYFASTKPGGDGAIFYFKLAADAAKAVDAWWTAGTNRSANATFHAFNAQGNQVGVGVADQRVNGGAWRNVGTFNFTAGWNKIVISRSAPEGSVVVADAIQVR